MMANLMMAAGLVVTALLAAFVALAVMAALQSRREVRPMGVFAEAPGSTVFLFDGDALVDATPGGRALLAQSPMRQGLALPRLLAWLEPRFPDASAVLATLPVDGRAHLAGGGPGDTLVMSAELRGGLLRIAIDQADATLPGAAPVADRAQREELELLRKAVARAPLPIWREDSGGAVIWGNAAYLDLAMARLAPEEELSWPLPRVFDPVTQDTRQRIDAGPRGRENWFDVLPRPDEDGRLLFALPADSAVQAEGSLKDFMQTLTKTFAQLRTGLAIFDGRRQLQLFNPALLDLTGLAPQFLTARPTLAAFFDALRDNSMIPEPRDYRNWRRQMVEMEAAAVSGLYDEVWTLPSGQSYRVVGRPHPNGALALMFDDITVEMSQTRRYRADLELGHAVIDALDDAVAVFSQSGVLVMSNAGYARLWGHDAEASLDGSVTVSALAERWRAQSAPTTLWDRVEDDVLALAPAVAWADIAWLADGRNLLCRLTRLTGGVTLVMFRDLAAPAARSRQIEEMETDIVPRFVRTTRAAG